MSNIADNTKVLVLNKSWMAVHVLPLRKALHKVCACYANGEPKAKIIDCLPSGNNTFQSMTWADWTTLRPNPHYCPQCHAIKDTEKINSCHCLDCGHIVGEQTFDGKRLLRVIQLTRYDRVRTPTVKFNRSTIFRRDQNMCQYCGKKPGTKELSLDHVFPRSKGGKTTWENIVLACTSCNTKKADRTLDQCGMKLLRLPVKPKSNHHFNFGDIRVKDWESFLSSNYWLCGLENDNV